MSPKSGQLIKPLICVNETDPGNSVIEIGTVKECNSTTQVEEL